MSRRVLLVHHPVGKRDDRASRMLAARGFEVEWCCPGCAGDCDALPETGEGYAAAIVYGGAENLSELEGESYLHAEMDWIRGWVEAGRPFLGICLGAQMLAQAFGAKVEKHPEGLYEIGYYEVRPTAAAGDFLAEPMHVYHWHGEGFEVPAGGELLASGATFPNQAFRMGASAYGIQFHPEASPAVFERWIRDAGHMLSLPGAHPAERQARDGARHDPPLRAWLDSFFDRWLDEG